MQKQRRANQRHHNAQLGPVSITQVTDMGRVYSLDQIAALSAVARDFGQPMHMDGARFANACAFLGGSAAETAGPVDALSFGCVKNGGMSAEAIIFFDTELADVARYRRKRAGHLQSKGRYLAAQLLAMLQDDLWLRNARAANGAAQEIAGAAGNRLMHAVEANEIFLSCSASERGALRKQGFDFYDWGDDAARLVTAWNTPQEHATLLAKAIASL